MKITSQLFAHIKDIQSRVQRFNVIALLKLLVSLGYPKEAIFFKSNKSLASSSCQIERIEFDVVELAQSDHSADDYDLAATVANIIGGENKYLFDLDFSFVENLNNGIISVKLQQKFLSYGYVLSQSTFVDVEKQNKSWILTDEENKHQYYVFRDKKSLNVQLQLYMIQLAKQQWLANFENVYFVVTDIKNRPTVYEHQKVTITINMGLFGSTGLLPSYFLKMLDEYMIESSKFTNFVQFFDNLLIKNYLSTIYPEYYRKLFYSHSARIRYALQDWSVYSHVSLQMLPTCAGTLHWIFTSVFPELGVKVDKFKVKQKTQGKSKMGSSSIGNNAVLAGCENQVETVGYRIQLYGDSFYCSTGRLWPDEIKKRLFESVFYALEGIDVSLLIQFLIYINTPQILALKKTYLGISELPSLLFSVPKATLASFFDKKEIPLCIEREWKKRGLAFTDKIEIKILQSGKKWSMQDDICEYLLQLSQKIDVFQSDHMLFSLADDYFMCSLNNDLLPKEIAIALDKLGYSITEVTIDKKDQNIWKIYFPEGSSLYIVNEQRQYSVYSDYQKQKIITVYEGLPAPATPVSGES